MQINSMRSLHSLAAFAPESVTEIQVLEPLAAPNSAFSDAIWASQCYLRGMIF